MLSRVLFGVLLVSTNALVSNAMSFSVEDLLGKMNQTLPDMYSKSYDEACEKVPPPPTNGRLTHLGSTSASIQFDWEDTQGACNLTHFIYALYQKDGAVLKTLGLSSYKHLRGVNYQHLKSGQEYFVHVYAFYAFRDLKSTNLTISFQTNQVQSGELIEHNDLVRDYISEGACVLVEAVTNGKATGVTSSSATVSFDWKSIEGDCWALILTGLMERESQELVSLSFSYSPHYRAHYYANLRSDNIYKDRIWVVGNGTDSPLVDIEFRTSE